MTPRVRLFADRDYAAFVRIRRLAEQRDISVALAREQDGRWDHARYEKVRVVAVDEEDAPIGYGEIHHEPSRFDPRRYFVRLAVDPRLRRQGIGAALWTQLRAELDERSAKVACLWADDGTACREFIVRRGFVEVVRSYEQVLALATAPLHLAAAEQAVAARGIRVETLSELRARKGDDSLKPIHELYTASRVDQPTLGTVTAQPFEDWRREVFDELHGLPDAYFVASDSERLVGCSAVHAAGEDVLRILITGVLPEYRRQGIARVLKLRVHAWARANGYREIHTSTANVAVVALNTALGYAIVDSWGGYELAIR
ncbi:MAG TPA: GNAT family N-acetyltransferase [Methylomirabilota bacterium]|nr:GNAT family N-acetyltransferase [Methylomirabilota bacterium]